MSDTKTASGLLTLGQLHEQVKRAGFQASLHQLKYALDQYHIEPAGRVGILRVWTEEAVPLAISALKRIASNRGGRA